MATVNERSLGVARLYARAMLEVAQEEGQAESLEQELESVLEQAELDEEFRLFLLSPVLERDRRRKSLESMLRGRASDLLVDSLQVINKKDRLAILDQILQAYREAHMELRGEVEVLVTTAVELSDEQRKVMVDRASAAVGKKAVLVEKVDPDLLGGLVVLVGDQKVDLSVRRDLELMSARFAQRLSSELLEGTSFSSGELSGDEAGSSHDGREEE